MNLLFKVVLVPPILFGLLLLSQLFYTCYEEIIAIVLLGVSILLVRPIARKFKPNSSFKRIIIALLFLITTPLLLLHIIVGDLYFQSSARSSGIDSTIAQQVSSLRAQAEIYYVNNGNSYESVCSSEKFVETEASVVNWMNKKSVGCFGPLLSMFNPSHFVDKPFSCSDNAEAYVAEAALPQIEKYYCVDSTGDAVRNEISVGNNLSCQ